MCEFLQISGLQVPSLAKDLPEQLMQLASIEPRKRRVKWGSRVAWEGSCGCYAITNVESRGVSRTKELLHHCQGCNGRSYCYCAPKKCLMCNRQDRPEQQMLLKQVKKTIADQELLLFTEVPLTAKDGRTDLRIDCLVVVKKPMESAAPSDCMLAIELDGRSHTHAFPVHGCHSRGKVAQVEADRHKTECIGTHNIVLIRWQKGMQASLAAQVNTEIKRIKTASQPVF